jgi:hypothetical protein
MGHIAQGTIRVKRVAGKPTLVAINPISDYRARHKKDYTVFLDDSGGALVFPIDEFYPVEDKGLVTTLRTPHDL